MNKIIEYFDLGSGVQPKTGRGRGPSKVFHWLPQYATLVLGILVQPFFADYQQTAQWNFRGIGGRVLFAAIVGLVVFPAVYKRAFDPDKPLFVQLCAIFALGMGWESLLRTALKVAGV